MGKLATEHPKAARPLGPTATTGPAPTHEGGAGFAKDERTELFTLAVTNFVSEETFYEKAGTRDARFEQLVKTCAGQWPEWTAGLIGWLRSEGNMRTASIVAAVLYAEAGAPGSRRVIDAACQRADEPAEALAFWLGRNGRPILSAVKRGVADACVRLYNERSFVKYDSGPMRFGDVIDLVHPSPKDPKQAALFRYALDVRHNRDDPRMGEELVDLATFTEWRKAPDLAVLPRLATWENVSSHVKPGKAFWEALVPQMGYMALLRNLRNIENAGVSDVTIKAVVTKLTDPVEVAQSRQFPFRFWSAWKHSGTIEFGPALEKALDLSVANIPAFHGRTLALVDTSSSMNDPMSGKSKIMRVEAAALFASAVAARSETFILGMYASGVAGIKPQRSVLRTAESIYNNIGIVGHGTETWPAVAKMWADFGPFDRILVFTDCQHHPSSAGQYNIPATVPIYVWDLAGYKPSGIELGRGRYLLGGLSDQAFKLVHLLERGTNAGWPWE